MFATIFIILFQLFRSPFLNRLLFDGNLFFTAVFAFESFAKLFAMGPRHFFAVKTLILIFNVNVIAINVVIVAGQSQ